jgi:D-3-phosphoglycerate dehydrogenase
MPETIVVTDHTFESLGLERELFADTDATIRSPQVTTEDGVIEATDGATAVFTHHAPVTRAVFEANESIRAVGRYGTGVDNVDLEAATDHGVQVVNVASYSVEEVSTHALALLLSVVRNTAHYDRHIKDGGWEWQVGAPLHRLSGKTVGLVGFGEIARRLAEKLAGFDFEMLAYDPYQSADEMAAAGVQKVSFDDLVDRAEVVSIHVPLTDETHGMFDDDVFERLSDSAIVVNASRGAVVDVESLYEAVETGSIYGAALDVLPEEPPLAEHVRDHDRIVYTPHMGWYSEESITQLRETVTRDVMRVLHGDAPENPVNDLGE